MTSTPLASQGTEGYNPTQNAFAREGMSTASHNAVADASPEPRRQLLRCVAAMRLSQSSTNSTPRMACSPSSGTKLTRSTERAVVIDLTNDGSPVHKWRRITAAHPPHAPHAAINTTLLTSASTTSTVVVDDDSELAESGPANVVHAPACTPPPRISSPSASTAESVVPAGVEVVGSRDSNDFTSATSPPRSVSAEAASHDSATSALTATSTTTTTTTSTNTEYKVTTLQKARPSCLDSEEGEAGRRCEVTACATRTNATATTTTSSPAASNSTCDPLAHLSTEQYRAYYWAIRRRRSVFITGGAGTGKSHLLRTLLTQLPISTTFVTATTGLAAMQLGGTTLHSFAGCGVVPRGSAAHKVLQAVMAKDRTVRQWRRCRVLVVDEVSMLDAWLLDVLDYVARHVRHRQTEPFGGIQLILSGDFLQLPPVAREVRGETAASSMSPLFCFEAAAWLEINPVICHLSQPYRQKSRAFFDLLNEMRLGELRPESVATLNAVCDAGNGGYTGTGFSFVRSITHDLPTFTPRAATARSAVSGPLKGEATVASETANHDAAPSRMSSTTPNFVCLPSAVPQRQYVVTDGNDQPRRGDFDGYTLLRPTRAEVERENAFYYDRLTTEEICYCGQHSGRGSFPAANLPELVRLREGCRVMLIKNLDTQLGLVNGSTGTVTGFIDFRKGYVLRGAGADVRTIALVCRGRGGDTRCVHTLLPVVRFDLRRTDHTIMTREVVIEPQEWKEMQGSEVLACSTQMPLLLAYAITIHKSQGMTLSSVDIDFSRVFEAGQAYVALSRCTDLQTLRLHGFSPRLVNPHPAALAYYKALELYQQTRRQARRSCQAALPQPPANKTPVHLAATDNKPGHCTRERGDNNATVSTPQHDMAEKCQDDGDGEEEQVSFAPCGYDTTPEETAAQAKTRDGDGQGGTGGLGTGSQTSQLESLRRRILPLIDLAAEARHVVRQSALRPTHARNTRLVIDESGLLSLITSGTACVQYETLFAQQANMMRVPLVVMRALGATAALRPRVSLTAMTKSGGSASSSVPYTPRQHAETRGGGPKEVSQRAPSSAPAVEREGEDGGLEAAELAAEALALIERARTDFVADIQRESQSLPLPAARTPWLRFAPLLPLVQPSVTAQAATAGTPCKPKTSMSMAASAAELDLLLHRGPGDATQHAAILSYAAFLRATYGEDTMLCTDSVTLAAHAMAFGFRVVMLKEVQGDT